MARPKRDSVFGQEEVAIAHCVQRCMRGALAGKDEASGKDFEHRRGWIRLRIEVLASAFGVDVLNLCGHVESRSFRFCRTRHQTL
ncbi:MAG: hypothetical protein U0905_01455 [Pirellulales bacterium]